MAKHWRSVAKQFPTNIYNLRTNTVKQALKQQLDRSANIGQGNPRMMQIHGI